MTQTQLEQPTWRPTWIAGRLAPVYAPRHGASANKRSRARKSDEFKFIAGESEPISLPRELMDVAASSRHVWAGRFNLYVELEPSPSFYCAWWIARLAIVRMIGLTADARLAESGPSPSRLPALWLRGAQRSGLLEISVCAERLQPEADAAAAQSAPTDSLLLAYASVLCGEIPASGAGVRGNGLTLRFPVSSEPLPQICVVA